MKKTIISLIAVFAVCAFAEPEGLTTLKNTYRDQLSKIADEEMAAIATAQEQYIAALGALEKKFQSEGKLDPLLKAQQEKKRFTQDRIVLAKHVVLDVPEISSLQNQYISAVKAVPLEPAQKKLTLAGFYERSLKKLEEQLTKQNDIQGALAAKAEREGIGNRAEIAEAQNVVVQATKPQVVHQATADTPVVDKVPVVEKIDKPATLGNNDKSKIEVAVKARFNKFVDAIEDQDWDDAVEFVDPAYVKESGSAIAKGVLKMKYAMARIVGDDPSAKIRSKAIEVSEDGSKVSVTPELWAHNRGRSLQKMNWITSDGQWYLSLKGENVLTHDQRSNDKRPFKRFPRR